MLLKNNSSTVRSRDLAARCVAAREEAGLSAAEMAHSLCLPDAVLAAFEAGQGHFPDVRLVPYLTRCGLKSEAIMSYVDLAHTPDTGYHVVPFTGRFPDELLALAAHETTASRITEYAPTQIPQLLQTPAYARALLDCAGELTSECLVQRQRRQALLEGPVDATFFVAERVLRWRVGGPDVMSEQLDRLLKAGTVRVVPDDQLGFVGAPQGFRLLTYADQAPAAIEELLVALVFVDSEDAMTRYAEAVERLDRIALDVDRSRGVLAEVAA
jgi:uncharacterized protein DUF5753